MKYYLDGYNYLFVYSLDSDSLENSRSRVLEFFSKKLINTKGMKLRVVFDAYKQPEGLSRTFYQNLEVIYTPFNQSADAYIIERVELGKDPSQISVVSNDRNLIKESSLLGALTYSFEAFLKKIEAKVTSKDSHKNIQSFNSQDYDYFLKEFKTKDGDESN